MNEMTIRIVSELLDLSNHQLLSYRGRNKNPVENSLAIELQGNLHEIPFR